MIVRRSKIQKLLHDLYLYVTKHHRSINNQKTWRRICGLKPKERKGSMKTETANEDDKETGQEIA